MNRSFGVMKNVVCAVVLAGSLPAVRAETGEFGAAFRHSQGAPQQTVRLSETTADLRLDPFGTDTADGLAGSAYGTGGAGAEEERSVGTPLASDHEDYDGGRGLITLEGVSGMFLNPTSGTLPAGSLTAQYCAAVLDKGGTEVQHTAMFSYGVTDWFEIGALGRVTDPANGPDIGGGGPLARLRLLKDESWLPELSVGGMLREGNERIDKRTVFVAASKRLPFKDNALFLLSLRGHVGFRQIWQNSRVNEANGSIVYGGLEVEFPYNVYAVGELSTRDDVFAHYPYSFGLQWRPTQVVGLSLAGIQTGGEDQIGFYAGIGVIHQF